MLGDPGHVFTGRLGYRSWMCLFSLFDPDKFHSGERGVGRLPCPHYKQESADWAMGVLGHWGNGMPLMCESPHSTFTAFRRNYSCKTSFFSILFMCRKRVCRHASSWNLFSLVAPTSHTKDWFFKKTTSRKLPAAWKETDILRKFEMEANLIIRKRYFWMIKEMHVTKVMRDWW